MNFTYDHPLILSFGPKPLSVVKVKHGVTEASLSDGRILRLSINIEGVAVNAENKLDVNFQVITEVMSQPEFPIADVHEGVQ
jgi:hypothetical protein